MRFEVTLSKAAERDLNEITDQRTYTAIDRKLDELQDEPHKRGEELRGELRGYRKLKVAKRYRIIYRVEMRGNEVIVEVIRIRRQGDKNDAYEVAKKRLI